MAEYIVQEETMTELADVIREKTGTTEELTGSSLAAAARTIVPNVQGDWNQNDETAADYVKNRTHWFEKAADVAYLSITGVAYDKVVEFPEGEGDALVEGNVYFATVWATNGDGEFVSLETWDNITAEYSGAHGGVVLRNENAYEIVYYTYLDVPYYEASWSLQVEEENKDTWSTFLHIQLAHDTYHTLPDEYISETIARVKDIPVVVQPDHAQNDPAAADYIKNRTHWAEMGEKDVILDEISTEDYDLSEYGDSIATLRYYEIPDNPFSALVEGYKYVVVLDGEKYECECKTLWYSTVSFVYLTDGEDIFSVRDDGAKFLVYYTENHPEEGRIMVPDTSVSHTVKVYQEGEVYHTISPDYLPEGVPYVATARELIPGDFASLISNDAFGANIGEVAYAFPNTPAEGDVYAVVVNDVEYTGELKTISVKDVYGIGPYTFLGFGNEARVNGENATSEPFYAAFRQDGVDFYFNMWSSEIYTFAVWIEPPIYHPLAPSLGGVPTPTSEDEGKVLTVSGGAPAWGEASGGADYDIVAKITSYLDSGNYGVQSVETTKAIAYEDAYTRITSGEIINAAIMIEHKIVEGDDETVAITRTLVINDFMVEDEAIISEWLIRPSVLSQYYSLKIGEDDSITAQIKNITE